MTVIRTIEDAIIAEVQGVLGNKVREIDSVQGGWTLDMLKRALQMAPSVYVAFLGARRGTSTGYFDGHFAIYLVTKAPLELHRRRGSAREIGAYDMIGLLTPPIDGLTVAGVGTLKQKSIDNLFRDAMFDLGGTVYGLMCEMPNMSFDYQLDEASSNAFITFANTQQIGDANTDDLNTELTLPQE